MPPADYAHVIIACLIHDIGYVRGIFRDDDESGFVIDAARRKVRLPRGSSDASLLPYHVDRSKLFVQERIQGMELLDASRIARAIEGSRFPSSMPASAEGLDEEAALLRAADPIGQLGDPHYIRKANALYYEFEEAPRPGLSAVSHDLIAQCRLAPPEPREVLLEDVEHIVLVAARLAGGMRRDQCIRQRP